jgi:hypothetical protein
MNFFQTLPKVLLEELQSYLKSKEWMYLMNINKFFSSHLKKETIFLKLKSYFSLKYLRNQNNFQLKIQEKILSTSKQLCLDFYQYEGSFSSFSSLNSNNIEREGEAESEEAKEEKKKIEKIDNLIPFSSTTASSFLPLSSQSLLPSFLANIHTLYLIHCPSLTDVSILGNGNLQRLFISDCEHLTDISNLENLHTLHLIRCPGINEVNHLTKLIEIDLSYSINVKDVSSLGNVSRLSLAGCYQITDFSSLGNHEILNLSDCYQLKDVSHLGNVRKKLYLSRCRKIKNVDNLGLIPILYLSGCDGIEEINFNFDFDEKERNSGRIRGNKELYLSGCSHLRFTSSFLRQISTSSISILYLAGCNNLKDSYLSSFKHLKVLNIAYCNQLIDISSLKDVYSLNLSYCSKIIEVNCLTNVKILFMRGCSQITDTSLLLKTTIKR